MDCPVCGRDDAREFREPTGDFLDIECPRCGKYRITGTAIAMIGARPDHDRMMVSAYVRHSGIESAELPVVSSQTISTAVAHAASLTVPEKLDALVSSLAKQSKHPGARVPVLRDVDHVLAWSETPEEFDFHFDTITDMGLVRSPDLDPTTIVTAAGWQRVSELAKPNVTETPDVFVAMSFDKALDAAWSEGLLPGIAGAGYRARRVDSEPHNDRIDDRIMAMIRSARFVVVDVTLQNRGAYFEAGFSLGLGRPVVWSVRQGDLENVHFDTRQFNHVVWNDPDDLRRKIRERIVGVFGQGPLPVPPD